MMKGKYITYDYTNKFIENDLKELLSDENTLLFDTETTGLVTNNPDPKSNSEIVELALVDTKGNTVYHSLFKPETEISSTLAVVNDIDQAKLENAPYFKDEWPKIRDLINNKTIVGFNNEGFDNSVLRATCERYGYDLANECNYKTVDMMPIYIRFTNLFRLTQSRAMMIKQEVARNILGLTSIQTHRADDDCRDLLELMNTMIERLEKKIPVSAEAFIDCQPKESNKRKYASMLKTEKRTQALYNDLVDQKPLDDLRKEYQDLGTPSHFDDVVLKLQNKFDLKLNDELELPNREEIIKYYQDCRDYNKTCEHFNIDFLTLKRNLNLVKRNYEEPVEKVKESIRLEDIKSSEENILDEYAELKIEEKLLKQEIEKLENQAKDLENEIPLGSDCNLVSESFRMEYKAPKESETFDSSTFKRENPVTYYEYLKHNDDGTLKRSASRETLTFKPNKEYSTEKIRDNTQVYPDKLDSFIQEFKADNIQPLDLLNSNVYFDVGNVLERLNQIGKNLKELDPQIKKIMKNYKENSNNSLEISTKLGSFTYSVSEGSLSFDHKKFKEDHPELRKYYTKIDKGEGKFTVKEPFKRASKSELIKLDDFIEDAKKIENDLKNMDDLGLNVEF